MKQFYNLKNFGILFLSLCFGSVSAQDYAVTPIPHQVYTATSPVQGTADDTYSQAIALPFGFDFYGTVYNQVSVGTNGVLTFNTVALGDFCPWAFTQTVPGASFPIKNSILGPYHDLNNSDAQGTLTYAIVGSAPYRKLVVMFNNHSQFMCNAAAKSSFQMIIYETLNIVDVQIIQKQTCTGWNGGRAVIGIINADGTQGITPPGRNTGAWTATQEGWRFARPFATNTYQFTKCGEDSAFDTFNLTVAQNDLDAANPSAVNFYATAADAAAQVNPLPLSYMNTTANMETIYANVNGEIKAVELRVLLCANDYDMDNVATSLEDLNNDSNLANDDTDGDGIPNFNDNEDDGDLVLTSVEYVFTDRNGNTTNAALDTDNDGIPNYLDNDDDGDGVWTIYEDYNHNNNPLDDDTNGDTIPDYLQSSVLGVAAHSQTLMSVYPNPVADVLNINNPENENISAVAIYSVTGALVKKAAATNAVSVSDLAPGMYFVKIEAGQRSQTYKFIKK